MRRFSDVRGTPHLLVSARSAVMSGLCFLLLALAGSACSNVTEACTLAGCETGLSVELVGNLPVEYTVSAEVPGGGPTRTIECSLESGCRGNRLFFRDFTPDSVRITVETDGTTTTELFEPSYEVHRPNGPACPPECLRAVVFIELQEG